MSSNHVIVAPGHYQDTKPFNPNKKRDGKQAAGVGWYIRVKDEELWGQIISVGRKFVFAKYSDDRIYSIEPTMIVEVDRIGTVANGAETAIETALDAVHQVAATQENRRLLVNVRRFTSVVDANINIPCVVIVNSAEVQSSINSHDDSRYDVMKNSPDGLCFASTKPDSDGDVMVYSLLQAGSVYVNWQHLAKVEVASSLPRGTAAEVWK